MNSGFKTTADAILAQSVQGPPAIPGIVAMLTDAQGITYEGAAGVRVLGSDQPMTTDTVFAIFSCSKAITGTAVLQLVEEGRLDLDAPASRYTPEIAKAKVLEGLDDAGRPRLRAPRREITTRMLMLHTAGFGYEFSNQRLFDEAAATGRPSIIGCTRASLRSHLIADPGEQWEYGMNIDWCGQVVEGITGQRLGQVMKERIFEPLGMADTGFTLTPSMRQRLALVHQRGADGSLVPMPEPLLPAAPEVDMGGHGLYATVGDYCRFIRMWLNDGAGPHGRVLKPETVRMAEGNGLGELKLRELPSVMPEMALEIQFMPGQTMSWAYSFMLNDQPMPTGRPANTLAWSGIANLYYWIDRQNGIGGFYASQVLPYGDMPSLMAYAQFEMAAYAALADRAAA